MVEKVQRQLFVCRCSRGIPFEDAGNWKLVQKPQKTVMLKKAAKLDVCLKGLRSLCLVEKEERKRASVCLFKMMESMSVAGVYLPSMKTEYGRLEGVLLELQQHNTAFVHAGRSFRQPLPAGAMKLGLAGINDTS